MSNRRPDELSSEQLTHCVRQIIDGRGPPAECFAILYEISRRHAALVGKKP